MTTPTRTKIQAYLAIDAYCLRLLQSLFDRPASTTSLATLIRETSRSALSFCMQEPEHPAWLVGKLDELEVYLKSNPEQCQKELQSQYTRLFYGPGDLSAPPWESFYSGGEYAILQKSTLEVRRCYLKHGFLPSAYPHTADDHIALELDFCVQLINQAEQSADQVEDFNEILIDLHDFTLDHLQVLASGMQQAWLANSETNLYFTLIQVLNRVLPKIQDQITAHLASSNIKIEN